MMTTTKTTKTATEPRVAIPTHGRRLLGRIPADLLAAPIVLTQPEPWALVAPDFGEGRAQVAFVTDMEHRAVQAQTAAFEPGSAVFGVGGGSALDHAKYVAWKRGLPLVLLPSALSADAAFTKSVAVREGQRVRYVGEVLPDHLLFDFELIQAAPALMNRSGVGDVLSIFTASWDWREAGARLGEVYDGGVAAESRRLLDALLVGRAGLRDLSEDGLRLLAESFAGEVRLCEIAGSSRPEEGSEHHIAYCLEELTRRPFLHGRLISVCVLVAGIFQGQDVAPLAAYLHDIELDCRLNKIDVYRDELIATLCRMHEYVREEEQLLPGVFHFRDPVTPLEAAQVLDAVESFLA